MSEKSLSLLKDCLTSSTIPDLIKEDLALKRTFCLGAFVMSNSLEKSSVPMTEFLLAVIPLDTAARTALNIALSSKKRTDSFLGCALTSTCRSDISINRTATGCLLRGIKPE